MPYKTSFISTAGGCEQVRGSIELSMGSLLNDFKFEVMKFLPAITH